jgi:ABC-2 type transport system ATP-binding protein
MRPMTRESLVTVQHLTRYYGPIRALEEVSFEVKRGEVLGFLGPNGAGKSTTMQIISGALAPSAGRVLIGGVDILDRPKVAKRLIGYMPEQPPLYRELTVDEYLRYCARLRGIARREVGAALARAKARCGLEAAGERIVGNLSKGYQQRTGIAQAILHSPPVVILDEPTVGLDPIQIREIRSLIRELGGDHSVILSTHILPEVQALCDRVQIIHQGRLVLNETVAALSARSSAGSLRVGLRRPPPIETLAALPGVRRVEPLDSEHLRLHHREDGADAVTESLLAESVRGNWGLYELVPERRTLEEIFVRLTAGETEGPAVSAPEAA